MSGFIYAYEVDLTDRSRINLTGGGGFVVAYVRRPGLDTMGNVSQV